jgi:hypothetical protein
MSRTECKKLGRGLQGRLSRFAILGHREIGELFGVTRTTIFYEEQIALGKVTWAITQLERIPELRA